MTERPYHILLVSNYFAPDSGAAAVRLTRLARTLRQIGHHVTVLTSLPHYPQGQIHDAYRKKLIVVEERDGIRVIQTWLWATPSSKISRKLISQLSFMFTALIRGLFLKRPNVILIEAQPIFTGLAGMLLAFWLRCPYVLNVSDLWPDHLLSVGALKEESFIYRVARKTVNLLYRRAAAIIAMSPAWAERIAQHIGSYTQLHVIYNGVDLDRFRPNLDTTLFRERYNIPKNQKVIAFVGTFATQYDFELMLNAAKMIQHPDVYILFVGKGSQADLVRQHLASPEFQHVHWIEWLSHDEMPLLWNSLYLTFWAMREHELYSGTIPAKLYEAMSCGVPMIAYGSGISADILQMSQSGIVLNSGGYEALANTILKLLDQVDQRQLLSQNARRYAEEHYDHEQVAQRYLSVLASVVEQKRS